MNSYGSLSVYSTDTFSEHYSQTRSSLPHKYYWQHFIWRQFETENIDVIL